MKIAVQLYTLREYLKTPEQIAETLKKVAALGYKAVEAAGVGEIDPKEFKELADREGLTICATHTPYEDLKNRMDAVIERHQLWGCQYVGLGGLPNEYRDNKEGYIQFAKEANEFGKQLSAAGLVFNYHNHDFEFVKFEGKTAMDDLIEHTDPESVNFELDVYWAQAGGADPIEWIRKLKGRIKTVHLKDMIVTPQREQRFAELGEGNMNFKGILEACRETGVEWGVVEQDETYERNPFDSLQISLDYLKNMGIQA